MNKLLRIIVCIAALAFAARPAFALNDTIGVTAGTPGKTANLISFASTHVISEVGLCDATVENQCGTLKAGNTAASTDIAVVVSDPNLLAAINASIPAGANLIGSVNVAAAPAGGATPSFVVAANSNNSTNLKGSAGTVYSIQTSNISATVPYFIKLYDKATAPTCGTDTPVAAYVIPAINGGNNVTVAVGKKFSNGIGYCVVTGIANSDNISVPAATILVNVDWN